MSSLEDQVGGDHYKKHGVLQPWEILREYLNADEWRGFMKGTAIVYLLRERDKGGDEDVRKAFHTLQRLVETMTPERQADQDEGFSFPPYSVVSVKMTPERQVHNPAGLTDPGEGFRFAYTDEKEGVCHSWWGNQSREWWEGGMHSDDALDPEFTYRVKLDPSPEQKRRVHNPAGLTEPGEGFRFAWVGEDRSECSHYYDLYGVWREMSAGAKGALSSSITYRVKLP